MPREFHFNEHWTGLLLCVTGEDPVVIAPPADQEQTTRAPEEQQ